MRMRDMVTVLSPLPAAAGAPWQDTDAPFTPIALLHPVLRLHGHRT